MWIGVDYYQSDTSKLESCIAFVAYKIQTKWFVTTGIRYHYGYFRNFIAMHSPLGSHKKWVGFTDWLLYQSKFNSGANWALHSITWTAADTQFCRIASKESIISSFEVVYFSLHSVLKSSLHLEKFRENPNHSKCSCLCIDVYRTRGVYSRKFDCLVLP